MMNKMTDKPATKTNTLLTDIDRAIEAMKYYSFVGQYDLIINKALQSARDFVQKCMPNEGAPGYDTDLRRDESSLTTPALAKKALEFLNNAFVEMRVLRWESKRVEKNDLQTIQSAILAFVGEREELKKAHKYIERICEVLNEDEYVEKYDVEVHELSLDVRFILRQVLNVNPQDPNTFPWIKENQDAEE